MLDKAKLEEKKKAIQSRFEQLEALRKQEAEKRAAIDRNLSEIVTEQTRLQGDNRMIEELIKDVDGQKSEPVPVIPNSKKKKPN